MKYLVYPQEGLMKMVLDVVCKMEIDEKTAKWKSEYKGKTYYFCAPMCKQKFDRNPEKYIKSK
jgi:YHS domain-containing protein